MSELDVERFITDEVMRAGVAAEWSSDVPTETANILRAALPLIVPVVAGEAAAAERARVAGVLAPSDPDARMNAYYYSFYPTEVGVVDAILSAVATAGKAYHHTEWWGEEEDEPSYATRIQWAANKAAAELRAAVSDV